MKRYSVSVAYRRNRKTNKIGYQYCGRTDNVEEAILKYKERLQCWIDRVTDENYEFRNSVDDYCGVRIADSQTKEVVYEECHIPEEYGYKKEYSEDYRFKWVKL